MISEVDIKDWPTKAKMPEFTKEEAESPSYQEWLKRMSIPNKVNEVEHPPHYNQGAIECISAIEAALSPVEFRGYCKGNALKYVWREQHKAGIESLQKAKWYLNRLIGFEHAK